MSDLQTAFYIIGIVFMSLMLLLTLVVVFAVVVIRAKIVAIHRHIDERLSTVGDWVHKGEAIIGTVKKAARKKRR